LCNAIPRSAPAVFNVTDRKKWPIRGGAFNISHYVGIPDNLNTHIKKEEKKTPPD